jgi:hypothetical protein
MEFDGGGGIAGGLGYGNGYTPQANAAIANNNAAYNNLQGYTAGVGAYDPFAQSGGFGNQTAYYAGLGADYSRAVPQGNVFGAIGGGGDGGGAVPGTPEYQQQLLQQLQGGGGIGSDAARAPSQQWETPYSQPNSFNPYDPQTFAPSAQPNLGTPQPHVNTLRDQLALLMMYSSGNGTQPVGMSTEDRNPEVPPAWFPVVPNYLQQQQRQQTDLESAAKNTSPAIDPTAHQYRNFSPDTAPGWGSRTLDFFPVQGAYPEPRQGFGDEQHPLIGMDKGDQGSRLLDPNLLNGRPWLGS